MRKLIASVLATLLVLSPVTPTLAGVPTINEIGNLVQGINQQSQNKLYIVKFKGPIKAEWKQELVAKGGVIGDYLPDFSFITKMDPQSVEKIKKLQQVASVTSYQNNKKLAPQLVALINQMVKEQVKGKKSTTTVNIQTFNPSGTGEIGKLVTALDGQVKERAGNGVTASLPVSQLLNLAANEEIVAVEQAETYGLFNDRAAGVVGASAVLQGGLDGRGQVVAVADTGLDRGVLDSTLHPDFQGRVKSLIAIGRSGDASDPDGHGTHVAGSIVGSGAASNGQIKGMAPGAQLVFQSIMNSSGQLAGLDITSLLNQAWDAGARIHSNSWGSQPDGRYTYSSKSVDQFIWDKDMTVLFAAGNSGDTNGDGQPDGTTVASPGTAKNAITVGAVENNRSDKGSMGDNPGQMAGFSSRGPTADGRIKPDVVAPGTWILSTKSALAPTQKYWSTYNNYYAYMGGTSMATPITAGSVALLRQYYTDRVGIAPKPSLLKASLINGAVDLGLPKSDQGWGRVDVKESIQPQAPKELRLDNETTSLSTGQSKEYQYSVESRQIPLKATLVWTDYPGNPSAAKALVNDLDLEVVSPSGQVYKGNDFTQPNNDTVDRVNNVENININNPEVGVYKIKVAGYNVPVGPQDYSLVASADFGSNQVPSPQPSPQPNPTPTPQPPAPQPMPPTPTPQPPQSGSGTNLWNAKLTGGGSANYYLDSAGKGTISARLSWAGTADLDMYLYDPAGKLVAKSDGTINPELITFSSNKEGRYRIRIKSYTGAAPYQLSASSALNSTKTTIENFQGKLSSTGNKTATHSVAAGGAGAINIEIAWTDKTSDFDLYLYDSTGQQVAKATSGTFNPETISYPIAKAGNYSLKIIAYKGSSEYSLKITRPK